MAVAIGEVFKKAREFKEWFDTLDNQTQSEVLKFVNSNGATTKATSTTRAKGSPNEKARQKITGIISNSKKSPKRAEFNAAKREEIARQCDCSSTDVKATLKEHFEHYNPQNKPGQPVWYKMKS